MYLVFCFRSARVFVVQSPKCKHYKNVKSFPSEFDSVSVRVSHPLPHPTTPRTPLMFCVSTDIMGAKFFVLSSVYVWRNVPRSTSRGFAAELIEHEAQPLTDLHL